MDFLARPGAGNHFEADVEQRDPGVRQFHRGPKNSCCSGTEARRKKTHKKAKR